MTPRSIRSCLSLVGMCLWVMLTRGIQGYQYQGQQPFWNSMYNNRIRPTNNAVQFPRYYFRPQGYPYRFLGAPIFGNVQWQPYPMGNGRWINSGNGFVNGFARPINFRPVPMFPTMPQQTTTQREQETSPWNEEAAPIEKSEESSVDRDISSTTEYPTIQETTSTRAEKNPREEPSTNEPVELDRESISPACEGNCKDARKDDISILIEEALQNGELLRSDEWVKWQNTMKRGTQENEQLEQQWKKDEVEKEKEDTRKKSTREPNSGAELDRGPTSSCRENCMDNVGNGSEISRVIDEGLKNGESSRSDEWIRKPNATKEDGKETRKPERDDIIQELQDPHPGLSISAPVCDNSTFCVYATDYPEELVNRAIRRNDGLKLLQSVDVVSEVGDRLEFDELNDSPFCGSYVRLIYPRSAETVDRRWLFVVNQNNLRQGVRIEMCAKEGNMCGDLDDYLPGGYKAFCKQKYIYRELVAVDNGIVKKESFRFPSSCCCHREFVG